MARRWAAALVFVGLGCILLWPVLFGGRVLLPGGMLRAMSPWNASAPTSAETLWDPLQWDSISYFHPSRVLLGRAIRSGEIPLWNPYQMCGTPFLANYQSAVLYPPNLLFAVMPADRAVGLLAFLHLIAAGGFTYVFLRGIGVKRAGSTFGGVAFMLSGFAVTWLELPNFLSTAVWLPLVLHFMHAAHESRRIRHTGIAAIALALSLVGGHPQIAFYCVLVAGLYWVYLTFSGWRKTSLPRSLVIGVMTFAPALALAAPQLLATAELAGISHRGGGTPTAEGYAAYGSLALPWKMLITLVIPDFLETSKMPQYAEYCGYVGILTLVLLLAAFGTRRRPERQAWFFGFVAAVGLVMALGGPLNRLLYFHAPGFAHSGSPARALFLFVFSAAILGGIGLDRTLGSSEQKERLSLVPILVGASIVLGSAVVLVRAEIIGLGASCPNLNVASDLLPEVTPSLAILAAGLVIIILTARQRMSAHVGGMLAILILAADLLAFGYGYNPTCKRSDVYPPISTIEFLEKRAGKERVMPLNDDWSLYRTPNAVLPPNTLAVYGLCDVQGYDALYPARYKGLLDAAGGRDSCPRENGNMLFTRGPASPVYDLLGVGWVVSRDRIPGSRKMSDGCFIARNPGAFPRAFVVHTVEYASRDEILRRIGEGDPLLRSIALVDANDGGYLDPWQSTFSSVGQPVSRDRARIIRCMCNKVMLQVEASRPGILILTDQFYPGWEARVDGKLANVGRVDYVFRGVAVQAGKHEVEFRYSPQSFYTGLRLTKIALVYLVCLGLYSVLRFIERRRAPR